MSRFGYSALAWKAFDLAFGPRMRLGVRATRVAGIPGRMPKRTPLILVSNHVSWWDGFILRPVQQLLKPEEPLHIVMKEEELSKRPFLRRLGGVGLEAGSGASLRRLLRDLREERGRNPAYSLLFFPQGRIWPSYRRPLGFQGGIRLIAGAVAPATILPVGLHLEGGKHMAPTAFVSLGEPLLVDPEGPDPKVLEDAVSREIDSIHYFLGRTGEDVDDSWPKSGEALPEAPAGVLERRRSCRMI